MLIKLLAIKDTDLPAVADVHISAFTDAALTQLGREAVRRYYAWHLHSPHDSLGVGAFADSELTGYCVAGVFRGSESGFLWRNKTYLMWHLLTHPWLFTNKMVRTRVTGAMQMIRQYFIRLPRPTDPPVSSKIQNFGVLAIAVKPQYHGLGVGKLLLQDVENSARQRGFCTMRLSVHTDNYKAISFYEKLGWKKTPAAEGKWLGFMVKEI